METIRKFKDEDSIFDRKVNITKEMFEDLYQLSEEVYQDSETEDEERRERCLRYYSVLEYIIKHTNTLPDLDGKQGGSTIPIWTHPEFDDEDSEYGEYLRSMCPKPIKYTKNERR
jgi:hypothetical protein